MCLPTSMSGFGISGGQDCHERSRRRVRDKDIAWSAYTVSMVYTLSLQQFDWENDWPNVRHWTMMRMDLKYPYPR